MYPIKKVEVDLKSAHHGTSLLGRIHVIAFVAIQSLSHAQLFAILWTAAREAPLSSTISRSLLRFMCIESVMLSNHLILCLPPSPFALHLSQHQGLSQSLGCLHQVAKVLELQLQHQSFQ